MTSGGLGPLAVLATHLDRAAILSDLDGTLCEIAPDPRGVTLVPGARGVLGQLRRRAALVAVISGRPADQVARIVRVPNLEYLGLYGSDRDGAEPPRGPGKKARAALLRSIEAAVATVPGAWIEEKGPAFAVHYRAVADPLATRRAFERSIVPVANAAGMDVIAGKRVLDLVPPDLHGKGDAVRRILGRRRLAAALYAGDDLADRSAFDAIVDVASRTGMAPIRVAVAGAETPAKLLAAADLVVDGPTALVAALREVLRAASASSPSTGAPRRPRGAAR